MNADDKDHRPLYAGGVPDPERVYLSSIRIARTPHSPTVEEGAIAVSKELGRPLTFIDDAGYEHEIIAGAIDQPSARVAWVESKCKELGDFVDIEFRLKAMSESVAIIDWVVETYNPYFGCVVGYLQWFQSRLVMIYREKHRTYLVSFSLDGTKRRKQIADQWMLSSDVVVFRSETPDFVDRLGLPDLDRLEPLSANNARDAGMLPPGFDRANEFEKRYRASHPPPPTTGS